MNTFGKKIRYTNSSNSKYRELFYDWIEKLTFKDYKNLRDFVITFGATTVTVAVYGELLAGGLDVVETITLSAGSAIPELTELDYYTYVT